ncbi:MAG: FAD-dependent oxidoreductase [Chloroflexota bacterium]
MITGNTQFKKLFEPGKIGRMLIKNRVVMAPMGTNYCRNKGYISQRIIDYYEARARGGAGLLIIEGMAVESRARRRFTELSLANDSYIPGLRRLVEAVHKRGARIAPQLLHRGQQARSIVTGQPPVSPSPFSITGGEIPHELTVDEIDEIVGRFAAAANRAKEAGCDGVELHAAHIYLISQFLSPAANKRTDRYGGTLENRARFFMEIIRAIRKAVGPDYPVWCRITAQEYGIESGITLEETKQVVRMAEEAGLDAINVSIFGYGVFDPVSLPDVPGAELPLAAEIKKVVHVPVIAVGWLNPEVGERALEEGLADFICIGRRLLADPEIVVKARSGGIEDIRPCIGCRECMQSTALNHEPVHCVVNASLGRERQYRIKPAPKKKRVIVVGGGPAGLEAARVAALRGHNVVLFEKDDRLGGMLNLAALPPYKEPLSELSRYLARQVTKAGVEVRLGSETTAEFIIQSRPDAVVVANGGIPLFPRIRGINKSNVLTAVDVLAGKATAGKNAVIIGGGLVGCETGLFLAVRGHVVTIVEVLEDLASDMEVAAVRRRLLAGLAENGVRQFTGTECEEITGSGLTVTTKEGKQEDIRASTIIIAAGFKPRPELFRSLRGMVPELHHIGDSYQPARIREAIGSGLRIGHAI